MLHYSPLDVALLIVLRNAIESHWLSSCNPFRNTIEVHRTSSSPFCFTILRSISLPLIVLRNAIESHRLSFLFSARYRYRSSSYGTLSKATGFLHAILSGTLSKSTGLLHRSSAMALTCFLPLFQKPYTSLTLPAVVNALILLSLINSISLANSSLLSNDSSSMERSLL